MERTYAVRTYGCQMNEHDSERIAGLLEADGLVPASTEDEADVIVLNTCCIRENADNKLYGALGHLKALKDARPDVQLAVGGCLAQKDRDLIQRRAGHVDVVFGTHNVHRAAELLAEARANGPVLEILEETARDDAEAFPSALPTQRDAAHKAWVTIQIGCDNSCAFCIVPSVRGPEISRPFGELLGEVGDLAEDGVTEVTLLGQNVNSYGRDLTVRLRSLDAGPADRFEAGVEVRADDDPGSCLIGHQVGVDVGEALQAKRGLVLEVLAHRREADLRELGQEPQAQLLERRRADRAWPEVHDGLHIGPGSVLVEAERELRLGRQGGGAGATAGGGERAGAQQEGAACAQSEQRGLAARTRECGF